MPEGQRAPYLESFGRRRGRPLSDTSKRMMALVESQLAVPVAGDLHPVQLFSAVAPLHIEIGFGDGEHLAARVLDTPHVNFIGCEVFEIGVAHLIGRVGGVARPNLRVHKGDARDVLTRLPPASVSAIYLFYPDPWPKLRHQKRRIVNPQTLDMFSRVLAPGGVLRLATDHADYATWMLERMLADARFAWTAKTADDWRTPPVGWVRTKYEKKALNEGRTPAYFTFIRQ